MQVISWRGEGHGDACVDIDQSLGVRPEGLGQCAAADQEPRLNVPVERIRGEIGGGDERLFVVLDDGLGVKDGPWAVTRVDGTWVVVHVRSQG